MTAPRSFVSLAVAGWRAFGLAALLLLLAAAHARADTARYFYDPAGRLTAMVDPVNGSAQYNYDAVGNILSVIRLPITSLFVAQVTPSSAPVGTVVTISGTGFGTTANTSVSFNGHAAAPSAVSATQITVPVPSGATSGPVSVTSPAGTMSTAASFTIPTASAPRVSGVSPAKANQGTTVTVSGSNFDPVLANNKVLIDGRYAYVASGTASSLSVLVPIVGSGKVTVSTPAGSATGSAYLVVPPLPYLVSNLTTAVPVALGGTATGTISTAGQAALVLFDAPAGMRLFVPITASSFNVASISVYGPDGAQVGATANFASAAGYIDAQVLQTGGTYAILIAGLGGATGSATVSPVNVPPDVTGTIVANATPVTLTTTAPGQNMSLSFTGTAGQRVNLQSQAGAGMNTYCGVLTILQPDGATQLYQNSCPNNFLSGVLTLPVTGTYTILNDPPGDSVGATTFTLYSDPPDPTAAITANATPVSLTTTAPGQNMSLSFSGTAGQRIGLTNQPDSGQSAGCATVAIIAPDGVTNAYSNTCFNYSPSFSDVVVLPATGAYTVLYSPPGFDTGTDTFTLYTVPPDATATIAANGTPVPLATTTPGQNMVLSFTGAAGQQIDLANQPDSGQGAACAVVTILAPDGVTQPYSNTCFNYSPSMSGLVTLPAAGTYQILYNPPGLNTGTDTFTLYNVPPTVTATIVANGTPVTLSTTAPAQGITLSFAGTAGQRISLTNQPSSGQYPGCATVSIVAPDGVTQVYSNGCFNYNPSFSDIVALATAGTYQIVYEPPGTDTGATTFTLYNVPPDTNATITPGGGTATITIAQPGQNGTLTFNATAGQRVDLLTQLDSGLAAGCTYVTVLQPDGTTQLYYQLMCSQSNTTGPLPAAAAVSSTVPTLPVSGTYSILLNPLDSITGTASLTLYNVPADATASVSVGGAAVTATTTVPGQAIRATFTGAANQSVTIKVAAADPQNSGCSQATTLEPDGSTILLGGLTCGAAYSSGSLSLPVAGAYTLVFAPSDTATGSYAVSVSTP